MDLDLVEVEESIRIVCSEGHVGSVPERYAGRKVRCRRCGEVLRVSASGWSEPGLAEEPTSRFRSSRREREGSFFSNLADRDRRPLIAGVAALVLLASTGLTMAVSGWRPWATDALSYVPRTMEAVGQLDVSRLRAEVPQVQEWFNEMNQKQMKKNDGELVFDANSIRRVVIAGKLSDGGQQNVVALLELEGFDIDRLKKASEAKERFKLKTKKHRGETYYVPSQRLPMGRTVAAYVISPSLVALGTESAVKQVIDVAEGKMASIRKNREIAPLLDDSGEQLLWFAALTDGKAREATKKVAEMHSLKVAFDYRSVSESAMLSSTAMFATSEDALKGEKIAKDALKQLEPKREAAAKAMPAGLMSKFEGLISSTSLETTGKKLEARVDFDVAKIKDLVNEADQRFASR